MLQHEAEGSPQVQQRAEQVSLELFGLQLVDRLFTCPAPPTYDAARHQALHTDGGMVSAHQHFDEPALLIDDAATAAGPDSAFASEHLWGVSRGGMQRELHASRHAAGEGDGSQQPVAGTLQALQAMPTPLLAAVGEADLKDLTDSASQLLQFAQQLTAANMNNGGQTQAAGAAGTESHGMATSQWRTSQLPDSYDLLYQHALGCSKAAAAEELMGNWDVSINHYTVAADLLLFLSMDWQELGCVAPGLDAAERLRLHKLYAAVHQRLAACAAEANSGQS